ncbi:elongation factor G, mitochondrial [Kwoniella shivajii]|uniref:Elongation factor G, mitochondrial n=1 Tax=Kwoniella shivajii TaxID=564305 RepID=A0ABZ1CPF1_9TREE|nr:elongation factor G, mitochondrial [Kwoniella shivajii]
MSSLPRLASRIRSPISTSPLIRPVVLARKPILSPSTPAIATSPLGKTRSSTTVASKRSFSSTSRVKDEEKPKEEWPERVLPVLKDSDLKRLKRQRNVGISAHIDSGKTTLTERILYYTGRIRDIHEVRGRDAVGAKMDSMELEREKGITIQSAATFADWVSPPPPTELAEGSTLFGTATTSNEGKEKYSINIIDTPGHVDFTIEVERALRVLDGAVLVLCAVSGVQSQTITVDRQMRRYNVPRLAFINKMDRAGSNPFRVIQQLRLKLKMNAAALQVPIGAEGDFSGVVDLVRMKALYNEGVKGNQVVETDEIPESVRALAEEKRAELIEQLSEADETLCDLFLDESPINELDIAQALRRATVSLRFTPVFMGSAIKNTGVQALLDGVCQYLPDPNEVHNQALDAALPSHAPPVPLVPAAEAPLVGLAFKLEEGRYGQLTYMRVYQGELKRGSVIYNARTGKKVKVPRLVRMHSDEMEDVEAIGAGEICAMFGVECSSGDTFTDGSTTFSMTSMFVPEPVISLSIRPEGNETPNFSRALNRFQKEDPTFRVHVDSESQETIISGMGELHLDIYVERMKREYNVACVTGKPRVAFRETITEESKFNYTHKKQSGGSGQFGRVIGRLEPMEMDADTNKDTAFENRIIGGNIPNQFIPAIEKGFQEALDRGLLTGHPISGCRFVLEDGSAHSVDSNELAFRLAAIGAFRESFQKSKPVILEPVMTVEVVAPIEFQGNVIGALNQRKGTIVDTEIRDDEFTLTAEVALNDMFGYSSQLRGMTQGKGEFSMEYKNHQPVMPNVQRDMMEAFRKKQLSK